MAPSRKVGSDITNLQLVYQRSRAQSSSFSEPSTPATWAHDLLHTRTFFAFSAVYIVNMLAG